MLKKKDKYTIAVVGATSAVGREALEILEERAFPVNALVALVSDDSEGERLQFRGRSISVQRMTKSSFDGVDLAFFFGDAESSREFAPVAVKSGVVVIDSSRAFRMDPGIPLVVPEANTEALADYRDIIASPGGSTVMLAAALKPVHDKARIRRVVATICQAVSGAGKQAIDELASQTVALLNFRDVVTEVYPHQIAFNCLPHVGAFLDSGSTDEEEDIAEETRKILGDSSIRITVTAVLVPVFRCHSGSLYIETETKISADEVRAVLAGAPGIVVYDDPKKNIYPVVTDVVGKDDVYVGRVREDKAIPNGVNFWVVADNLRKGAALNAIQIAEHLIK